MTRAGREPAEDVKRRLTAACRELGLTVVIARMFLLKEHQARVVLVGANVPDWSYQNPTLSLMATVKVSGDWPKSVDVRCLGADEDQDPGLATGPWMKGRGQIPFSRLIDELRDTLSERKQVIAAVKAGRPGPFRFARSVWANVDLPGELESS